jgi:hypothetical protein
MFDMSWTIFSRDDVEQFIAIARSHALVPCGPLLFNAGAKPVSCAGKNYTFAWLALQRQ